MSCIWTGYFYNLALFWSPAWHVCRRQLSIMPTRKAFIEWVMTSITVRHFCSVLSAFFPTHTKLPNYSIPKPKPKPFPSDLIGQLDLYLWAESITSHHPFSPLAMNYLVLSSSPELLNSTSRYNTIAKMHVVNEWGLPALFSCCIKYSLIQLISIIQLFC